MKSMITMLTLALLGIGMTGCVAQAPHDDLRTLYRQSQERIVELEQLLEAKNAEIAALQAASAQSSGADAELLARLAQAQAEAEGLKNQLKNLAAGPGGEISPELASALESLADQYPGLMTFDPDRKMIRMTSDLTFGLGSTKVKPAAAAGLAKLARVLNSAEAAQFEVRVVGHTDNVPVTNRANKAKFEDNWGLSAFRAKSVKDVLKKNGVNEARMSIAGYGDQQPVVANPAKGGAQANRRVEIYLVAPYNASGMPAAAAPVDAAPAVPASQPAPDEAMFK